MPMFDYTGQLAAGGLIQGTVEGAEQHEVESTLAQMGVRVTSLRPARRAGFVAPLSLADLTFFNDQLAALTKASLPLEPGLRQLASDVGSGKLKRMLLELADDLSAGAPLPQALERQQARFPPHYAAVVRAGLRTGDLSGTLYGLASHLRLKSGARRAIVELLGYPLVVLALTLGVTSFLMRSVVPMLSEMFSEMTANVSGWWTPPRPPATPFIFELARAWPMIEATILALVGGLALALLLAALPGLRAFRERMLRAIPGVAQVYWSSVQARFAHTSALGAYTGTPLPDLIAASGEASGSPSMARSAQRVAERLVGGEAIESATEGERDMPGLWTCAVQTAGPRGELPGALAELARTYETRAQQYVNAMRTILVPFLTLFLAGAIGGLVASLLFVMVAFLRGISN